MPADAAKRPEDDLPSRGTSTVENYLKAIYQGQSALTGDMRLVPMGQVALALGVTPGTATTMVKTLAEQGLAEYEPYSGVRLSAKGERLAGLVLRRHRLVELFLVQVMGMKWDEVHEDAELLEHAVSERLIERIDEMLGRPTEDPHGDPIPDPGGTITHRPFESLLTCPIETPLKVTRITDQDPAFLRFIEENDLKPGQPVRVESRDTAADAVRLRSNERQLTIGARAASKLLVEVDSPSR
jgi:DtxR family Mn-dependent transcriptional regulator